MSTPDGWTDLAIGDLLESCTYGTSSPLSGDNKSGIPVLRMGNIRDGRLDLSALKYVPAKSLNRSEHTLRRGDILFNRTNSAEHVGKVAPVETDAELAYASYLLRLRTSAKVDSRWLTHSLGSASMQSALKRIATVGVSQANINPSRMRELRVRVPPLAEQRKIARILSSVEESIEKTETVIEQLQVVKQAMMQELLTRGMPGLHPRFKQTEIGEVPEGWSIARAQDVCETITKGTTPSHSDREDIGSGVIPFLRVQNIGPGNLVDHGSSPTLISRALHDSELRRSKLSPGDVVMNIVGPPLGKVAIVPPTLPEANINQAIALFRPALVESQFLYLCLAAEHLFSWAMARAKRTSTQLNITLETCRDYPIPLPSPSERQSIIATLSSMAERMGQENRTLTELRATKAALSSALLSGELRVTP